MEQTERMGKVVALGDALAALQLPVSPSTTLIESSNSKQLDFRRDFYDVLKAENYKIDKNNEEAVSTIYEYFCDLLVKPQTKGLKLVGYFGTGKTRLMKIVEEFNYVMLANVKAVINYVRKYENVGSYWTNCPFWYTHKDRWIRGHWCFDECGSSQDVPVNIFGNQTIPMAEILKETLSAGRVCHIITNYDDARLAERWGPEVVDRFREMFIEVKFKGDSRRS